MVNKLAIYKNVLRRPWDASIMLWNHRRTLRYLWGKRRYRNLYNHIFTTYLIRGEDCGKGVLDPIWKLTGKAPFLWDIEVEVTTKCYLRCTMCEHTYWKDKSYLNQDLSFEAFAQLIDSIPNLKWINLTGEGSSFLNPDFMRMVEYVKKRSIYLDFSHDFIKLPYQDMVKLIKLGVDRIYWSFDGVTKETYEKIRVGADFDEVVNNIQRFVALKGMMHSPLPEICFRFCFFKDNWEEIPSIPMFLHSLVPEVNFYGDEPSINIVALLEFEETKDWAVEIPKDKIEQTNSRSKILGFKNYWSHTTHIEEEKAPMDYCTFWSEPYIMITGHAVPCCAVLMANNRPDLESMAFGNIYEQSYRDIWFSDRYKKFRKMVVNPKAPVPKVCLGCRAFNTENRARRFGIWK